MKETIATFNDVSYLYPRSKKPVLYKINLEIYKGEFLGLIGPTGAGKTTLCQALNGIVPQFYGGRFFGSVKIAELDTTENKISDLSRHVAAVFEDPETQLVTTSVENEIAFALENQKISPEEIRRRIPGVLEVVRLEGSEKRHPHELSGGQKQRLSIAAALATQPSLLILDEPTSQLDPVGAQEVFATVRELNREMGITVLMASHSAEEMAEYADRIALMSDAQLLMTGTPDEIYSQVDLLEGVHLRPPQVAKSIYMINSRGVKVPEIPVHLEKGKQIIEEINREHKPQPLTLSRNGKSSIDENKPAYLSVRNLKHVYPSGTQALHDISLGIREGEYVLIIGQNGAGKSTLVKHFLKLLEPTEGTVTVGSKDTRELQMSDLARRIGYVAQNPDNQIFTSSVQQEVSFALENLRFPKDVVEKRTTESLENMGLLDVRDRHPLSLPKGDRARVVIASILVMEPEIIIFDEPTTGQDYRGARYILDISRQLHEQGKTVIVITHHLYLMPEYAERVIVMGQGTIMLDAPIREAYHQVDLLHTTYLTPPQSVFLAQEIERLDGARSYPLLTPGEIADCFAPANLAPEVSHE